ncbi:hypothetical protein C8R34_101203 [Nitrosomonas sp. Nm84]|uniref:hypothetical protein n=1 Tax=Nitrosomonas sp. Nm84 TaxID=200124 RepID=UPI000D77426E|nr:hypothetical protein [Nitrosomonas sp. Nm84]PXW91291.1 hypothetical protein C8R34_101203 [Nitrosomonas sp. Nm84]
MLIKLFMVVALSLSVSCFAESGSNQSKSLIDTNQQTQSSSDTGQSPQSSKSDSLMKKRDAQSTEDPDSKKKPPMIQYCKEHLC